MIIKAISDFVNYGIATGLIGIEDEIYITNRVMEILLINDINDINDINEIEKKLLDTKDKDLSDEMLGEWLENILTNILKYATTNNIISDDIISRDLFDTKIMNTLVSKPREVINQFYELYKDSPQKATDFYYKLSKDSDYIRRYRIKKDLKWKVESEYGDIDITINLSKPEKDPRSIAMAINAKEVVYPKCLLCMENEGYAGRHNHPARQNHRIIPIQINDSRWGFQYSPYVYYNEHCIVFNGEHTPMKIDKNTFIKLFDFVKQFPHYFLGSNADLPIVGGSILSHDHFQGGNYLFPMAKSPVEKEFWLDNYRSVKCGIVKWPMSVIRLECENYKDIIELSNYILNKWINYNDEEAMIISHTNEERHNTITPIARKVDDKYQMDLVLRNNIITNEHPDGLFHPHKEVHNIKKENIGLIEVMGLAVLPSRLKSEIEMMTDFILNKKNFDENSVIIKHKEWYNEIRCKVSGIEYMNKNEIEQLLMKEIGISFIKCLEDAGVFKRTKKGMDAFLRFIESLD